MFAVYAKEANFNDPLAAVCNMARRDKMVFIEELPPKQSDKTTAGVSPGHCASQASSS
jgi:hypothetical protein